MRFGSALLCCVMGVGVLFAGGVSTVRADSGETRAAVAASADAPAAVAALPGSGDEARSYEQRETASPEVQDFKGGDVTIGVSVFVLILVIVIIILLTR